MDGPFFKIEEHSGVRVLRLMSADGTNRLTQSCMLSLTEQISKLADDNEPLVIAGNDRFFSAGADLAEIAALHGPSAYEFSKMGQSLMNAVASFPGAVFAAVDGYCMGGGLDLALACHRRVSSPHAIFGHRGAALGLITGWGGTQRLPRLVGKGLALEMFVAAEKLGAPQALAVGLIDALAEDPVAEAVRHIQQLRTGPHIAQNGPIARVSPAVIP